MARVRRRSGTRRKGRGRGWAWLAVGLALGAGVMYAAQHWLYRDSKPFASLGRLLHPPRTPATEKLAVPGVAPPVAKPAKPRLDFYTILPGETLLPDPKPDGNRRPGGRPDDSEKGAVYMLQAAAYGRLEDADRLKAKLALNGLEAHIEKVIVGDRGAHYRVRLGPYSSIASLDRANAKLADLNIKAMRLKVKKAASR